jgi:hypothetical protein
MQLSLASMLSSERMRATNGWTVRRIPTLIFAITIHLIQKAINVIAGTGFQSRFRFVSTATVGAGALRALASLVIGAIAGVD